MASLYVLLTQADPSGGKDTIARKPKKPAPARSKGKSTTPPVPKRASTDQRPPKVRPLELPEMRLNLEIRIDAGVTPEQIDQIFASMAKHLYHRQDEEQ